MKCNIWISNTSYIIDYNTISLHDLGIMLKPNFLAKYIKLQVPSTSGSGDNK